MMARLNTCNPHLHRKVPVKSDVSAGKMEISDDGTSDHLQFSSQKGFSEEY